VCALLLGQRLSALSRPSGGQVLQGTPETARKTKKKKTSEIHCWSVPPPPASAADEMIAAEPPRPLAVPVSALLPATATGGSIPAGLRMLSEAAASMPSPKHSAGDPGQAPAPWQGMPGAVPPGLPFNPTPGIASGQALPSFPAGSHPPVTVWNADLVVAFTALWGCGLSGGAAGGESGCDGRRGRPWSSRRGRSHRKGCR
jgi:hypothetical protein